MQGLEQRSNEYMNPSPLRIGLIADTHMPGSVAELWPQITDVFADVDMIFHAGDLHTADVIDQLSRIAPTYVARGNGDMDVEHPMLKDEWLLDVGGQQIGIVHQCPHPGRASKAKIAKRLTKHFAEQRPDLVIYGHTHHESVHRLDDQLFINPGSAMLPRNQSTRLGTVGLLEIGPQGADVQLLQLTDAEPIELPQHA